MLGMRYRHRSQIEGHDATLSIFAMVCFTVLATAVLVTLPALVGATVDVLRFSAKQAGLFAAADMLGATFSALIASIYISRWHWRPALGWALGTLALADCLSGLTSSFAALFSFRMVAGLCEGVLLAIGNASIGETRKPDRIYGFATAAQLAFGAAAVLATVAAPGTRITWGVLGPGRAYCACDAIGPIHA